MMVTPNENGEGGYLGMHVDATHHGIHKDWKREYSVIIGYQKNTTHHLICSYTMEKMDILKYHINLIV